MFSHRTLNSFIGSIFLFCFAGNALLICCWNICLEQMLLKVLLLMEWLFSSYCWKFEDHRKMIQSKLSCWNRCNPFFAQLKKISRHVWDFRIFSCFFLLGNYLFGLSGFIRKAFFFKALEGLRCNSYLVFNKKLLWCAVHLIAGRLKKILIALLPIQLQQRASAIQWKPSFLV